MVTTSIVSMHQGNAIILLANKYKTLPAVIFEQIQNALDKRATHISVNINFLNRRIVTSDNGDGVGIQEFNKALTSVAQSIKSRNKMGRFGLGLIAPLGKCRSYTFTSCPKPRNKSYKAWEFSTRAIARMKHQIEIPLVDKSGITFGRQKKKKGNKSNNCWWRTQVVINSFTKDNHLSALDLESMIEGITDRFSEVMEKQNTSVDLKIIRTKENVEEKTGIRAKKYSGKKLPQEIIFDQDSGKTYFNLYLAPQTTQGYKGKIVFGEVGDSYRFTLSGFTRSASELVSSKVLEALKSGFFEGEILSQKAKLTASRKSFKRNDALAGFCVTVEKWFDTLGEAYVKQYNRKNTDKRYQELGIKSLKTLESLLGDDYLGRSLSGALDFFREGTIGVGHNIDPDKNFPGRQQKKSKAISGGAGQKRKTGDGPEKEKPRPTDGERTKKNKKDRKNHRPLSVIGPEGERRRLVRSDSLGLQISFDMANRSVRLWEMDMRCGTLHLNIHHPLWALCERDDRTVLRLMEYVTVEALRLCKFPEDMQAELRCFSDEGVSSFVYLITQSKSFATQSQINKLRVLP